MKLDKIHNCNFLENDLPDGSVDLIIADPPYYEVKGEFDFIWPDLQSYLFDVEKWAKECRRLLKETGSLFWYGHAKKIAYSQIILDKYFNLENSIVWEKIDCQTKKGLENYRSFAPVTERILFYSLDTFNITSAILEIRDYLRAEIQKAKGEISFKKINQVFDTATNGGGVASSLLSLNKSEPSMITEHHYKKLQTWLNPHCKKDYANLRTQYEDLRSAYEDRRRHFNNYLNNTDVWRLTSESNNYKLYPHPTQKTIRLSRQIIKNTTKPGDIVFIPFAGSGTETAAAAMEKRRFIGFDIEAKYADMSNARAQKELSKHKRQPQLF